MALRNFNFDVSINGIVPNMLTDIGIQGDHGVTRLNFTLTEETYQAIMTDIADGKIMYRFDLYDGEGGIWQSEPMALIAREVGITLQERHTRFGGKIIIYLVITALSSDNKTEVELYNSPVVLQLKNRPNGVFRQGEDYESVISLAENVKHQVSEAETAANEAKEYKNQAGEFAAQVEEMLKNGEFNGVGIKEIKIIDNELIITYSNEITENLGNIKGEKGEQGDIPDLTNYYTKDDVDKKITEVNTGGSVDLSNYYTKSEADSHFANFDNRINDARDYCIRIDNELSDNYYTKTEINTKLDDKQNTLVSGTNIKTINGNSLLGEGNIEIIGSGDMPELTDYYTKGEVDGKITEVSNYAQSISTDILPEIACIKTNISNNYYTKDDVDEKITAVNTGGSVDLSNYYTKTEVDNHSTLKHIYEYSKDITVLRSSTERFKFGSYIELNEYSGISLGAGEDPYNEGVRLPIHVGTSRIEGLADPINTTDAVNKKYVDELVGDIETLLGGI